MGPDGKTLAMATVLRKRERGVRLTYISRGPLVLRDGVTQPDVAQHFQACIRGYASCLRLGEALVCHLYQSHGELGPGTIDATPLRPLFPGSGDYAFSALVPLTEPDGLIKKASSNWRRLFRGSEALLADVRSSGAVDDFLRAGELFAKVGETKGFQSTLGPMLLRAHEKARARVFYLEDPDGRMTAATFVVIAGRRASRVFGAVAPDGARANPGIGRVLEVAATRWAFENGATCYDLEGINPFERGVTDFKMGMRGAMFAPAGLHIVTRPAILGKIYSAHKRRVLAAVSDLFKLSKRYALQVLTRRLTGNRVAWDRFLLLRRDLSEEIDLDMAPGYQFIWLNRYDPSEFHYRLSTTRELRSELVDLEPGIKECGVMVCKDGFAVAYVFTHWRKADVPEIGGSLTLGEGEGYLYNGYIVREFRGQKLYSFLLHQGLGRLRAGGSRYAVAMVNSYNRSSIAGVRRVGFRPLRDLHMLRVGRWRRMDWRDVQDESWDNRPSVPSPTPGA